jgi:hypothetical protein
VWLENIFVYIYIYILYNVTIFDQFWPPVYRVTPLKTPFGLLIPLLQSHSHVTTFTHNYFLRCATFTQLTILYICDYNHLFHPYTGWLLSYQLLSQIITHFTSSHLETLAEILFREFPSYNWLVGLLLTNWLCIADGFQDNSSERTPPKTVAIVVLIACVANRCGATKYKHSSLWLARLTSAFFGFRRLSSAFFCSLWLSSARHGGNTISASCNTSHCVAFTCFGQLMTIFRRQIATSWGNYYYIKHSTSSWKLYKVSFCWIPQQTSKG